MEYGNMSNQWEKKESEDRIKKFMNEYNELVKKYDVQLFGYPELVPSGQTGFNTVGRIIPIDKKQVNQVSPIQAGDIIK